ncbi:MAG: DNA-binding response regulator [Pseudonocardia sp.]|nr:DNA-binding response regulator [Pseudonocardia sp.]
MAAVPVLVVGPHDMVTTSVVIALKANGFAAEKRDLNGPRPGFPRPDRGGGIVVVNLDLPESVGLIAQAVRAGWQTLAVGRQNDRERAAAAVAAGAAAYVPRSAPVDVLVRAVLSIVSGRPVMLTGERRAWLELHRTARAEVDTRRRHLDLLTGREFEVLRRLERGQKAADIAVDAVVAMSTVRTHIRSILMKLEVNSQQDAIALYRETRRQGE